MTRGEREDYTKLSWIVSRSATKNLAYAILAIGYVIAFSTFLLPTGAFPVAAPLLVLGLTVAWAAVLTATEADTDAVLDRLSKTGWQKETATHVRELGDIDDDRICDEPDCDVEDEHKEMEIAERYGYNVFYLFGTELARRADTERRVCPEHADEAALGVELHDPREEVAEEEEEGRSGTPLIAFSKKEMDELLR